MASDRKFDSQGRLVEVREVTRPVVGRFVLYYRNGRVFEGHIVQADRHQVTIRLHMGMAKQDETVITSPDGPWEFAPSLQKRIGLVLGLRSERCGRTRESINPNGYQPIILQCVKAPGHKGGCHFENPSNRKR